jgi:HD-like signal output (HDOD) protein/CheY-like chemotaxis protein
VMRVLFLDDDMNVLDGLRRALRSMRSTWDMQFVSSARQALEAFAAAPFDVVVSDMRMPEMDGADLLHEVMKRYPTTIRLILSGHADQLAIMKSIGVAHQFLSKPCAPELLQQTIERAHGLKALIESDAVRQVVSGLNGLPTVPALYRELVELLQSTDATTEAVAKVIGQDIGMTTRILQVANSAFFGLPKSVGTVDRAVAYLGLDTVGSLVLAQGVFASYETAERGGFDIEKSMLHAMRTAAVAKAIAKHEECDRQAVEHAFLAGMLHDVGSLVLAAELPSKYAELALRLATPGADVQAAEREIFGVSHAFVGAYLLGLWALPNPIVEAVAYHEEPAACLAGDWGVFGIVHVASCMATQPDCDDIDAARGLDRRYLQRVGVLDRWSSWRAAAAMALQGEGAAA